MEFAGGGVASPSNRGILDRWGSDSMFHLGMLTVTGWWKIGRVGLPVPASHCMAVSHRDADFKGHRSNLPPPRSGPRGRSDPSLPSFLWLRAQTLTGLGLKRGRGWHSLRRKFASDLMNQPLRAPRSPLLSQMVGIN